MPKRTLKYTKKNKKTPNKKRPIKHRKTAKQHKRRKSHKQRGGDGNIPGNKPYELQGTEQQQSQPPPPPQPQQQQQQSQPPPPPPSNEILPLDQVLTSRVWAAYGIPVTPLENSPSGP